MGRDSYPESAIPKVGQTFGSEVLQKAFRSLRVAVIPSAVLSRGCLNVLKVEAHEDARMDFQLRKGDRSWYSRLRGESVCPGFGFGFGFGSGFGSGILIVHARTYFAVRSSHLLRSARSHGKANMSGVLWLIS